jgi:hypothetical protein
MSHASELESRKRSGQAAVGSTWMQILVLADLFGGLLRGKGKKTRYKLTINGIIFFNFLNFKNQEETVSIQHGW